MTIIDKEHIHNSKNTYIMYKCEHNMYMVLIWSSIHVITSSLKEINEHIHMNIYKIILYTNL